MRRCIECGRCPATETGKCDECQSYDDLHEEDDEDPRSASADEPRRAETA